MKTYISGKITGLKYERALSLFESADNILKAKGLVPVNPMKLPHKHSKTWEKYMAEDIEALLGCEAIYMMSNWRKSKGARIEHVIAKELKLKISYQ